MKTLPPSIFRLLLVSALLAAGLGAFSLTREIGRSEAAVNRLQFSMGCMPNGTAQVAFYWYGGSPNATQTWIDASLTNNDRAPGTFVGAGPFRAADSFYEWRGLYAGYTHYIRINQQLPNGRWDASETYVVKVLDCTPREIRPGSGIAP